MTAPELDFTHDPTRRSWVASAQGHADFPLQNLPYGVFAPADGSPRAGVAIGDHILDLRALAGTGLLPRAVVPALQHSSLNALFALPAEERLALRRRLSELLGDGSARPALEPLLHEAAHCSLHLPAQVGDYTDFYVGIHHARTIGGLYRPDDPLSVNYKHLPVGYHGRASSVRVSGSEVVRPHGQVLLKGADAPDFRVCDELDYELELGVWVGPGNAPGEPVPIDRAAAHIVGLCLLNDWSARDFQAWERLPLGPFLGKSFHTSVSPWVVTAEALAPFRQPPRPRPEGDPRPLAYLVGADDCARGQFAIDLQASLLTPRMRAAGLPPQVVSRAETADMYWTVAQMLTHQTSNGCNLVAGDLLGSGTISGTAPGHGGCLMELTRGGREPVALPLGEARRYLLDGDEVVLQARASAPGAVSIGFGVCSGVIGPARGAYAGR